MDQLTAVKLEIYRFFVQSGLAPRPADLAGQLGLSEPAVRRALLELRAARVLWLEPDGISIRMAAPFSGVPTRHRVMVGGVRYFANCAWDALGIPVALQRPGVVESSCSQTGEALRLDVSQTGPPPCDWVFHSLVPAAHWWRDLVFT